MIDGKERSMFRSTYMSLIGVGFGEGLGKFASIISLKLLFPIVLASCNINTTQQTHYYWFKSCLLLLSTYLPSLDSG